MTKTCPHCGAEDCDIRHTPACPRCGEGLTGSAGEPKEAGADHLIYLWHCSSEALYFVEKRHKFTGEGEFNQGTKGRPAGFQDIEEGAHYQDSHLLEFKPPQVAVTPRPPSAWKRFISWLKRTLRA